MPRSQQHDHYLDAHVEPDDAHPVDRAVDRRLDHGAINTKIRTASKKVLRALGSNRADLYLRLEALINERHAERERVYFNLGYEMGFASGRADALPRRRDRVLDEVEGRIRADVMRSVAGSRRVEVLLRAALAVVGSPAGSNERATSRRRR